MNATKFKMWFKSAVIIATLAANCGCGQQQGVSHGVAKDQNNPFGANSIGNLVKDGDYYVVSGADLHNLAGDLIGVKIKFSGSIRDISHVPADKALLLSEDNAYFVIIPFGSLGDVPDDLKTALNKGGLQVGSKVTVYCTIDQLSKEDGMLGSALKYKSCIVKPVDRWQRLQ